FSFMRILASIVMSAVALVAIADEYIDPQSKVVYTYEPGSGTAMVKAGNTEGELDGGMILVGYCPGSPDAAGDVAILDRFTIGTEEYVVTSIGELAFIENKNIASVCIPETVTEIEIEAFSYCTNLIAVQLPEGLTKIALNLFEGCNNLVSVVIPSTVNRIEQKAFYKCSSLASLNLPAGIVYVGKDAFYGTPWYASMYDEAPDGPFYIGSLLLGYKGNKPKGELVIKEGTTFVGRGAFSNCSGLTSVTVPPSVACLGYDAFYNCSRLTAVYITDLAAWCSIEYEQENNGSNPLHYAHHLYLNGEEVTDLVITEDITHVGDYAFDYCSGLTSVTFLDGVTSIGQRAFQDCRNLTNVTIPSSMAQIGSFAFIWCYELNAVHISDLTDWCGIKFEDDTSNPLLYGAHLYLNDKEVTELIIPEGLTTTGKNTFCGCSGLTSVTIPNSVTVIGESAFSGCSGITSVIIGSNVRTIGDWVLEGCEKLLDIYCYAEDVPNAREYTFFRLNKKNITLHVPAASISAYQAAEPWNQFGAIVPLETQPAYRPFIEEGKVWKVGDYSGNPVRRVEYFYFDGDTIIDGKTCKQMMCQRYVSPEHPDYYLISQTPSLSDMGAWYEEDKKVYMYDQTHKEFQLMYDFSADANDTLQVKNIFENYLYIIGPKQTGGMKGFKGVYRDVMMSRIGEESFYIITWLEGVGSIESPQYNVYYGREYHDGAFLMSCTVEDEVIYLNDEVVDGATPEIMDAQNRRIDFTHTIKTKPKSPMKREAERSLYGEYNQLQLGINLDLLADAYLVCITDEKDNVVYEKTIDAAGIVGLNIDISAYVNGLYTITVENDQESFTGVFEVQATGIASPESSPEGKDFSSLLQEGTAIYNLQGQRMSSLRKGLNIVNGRKVYVK
ncbi:MAG: leucine-rich repeat domain-containing protein, partial [Bacteroidaceae bacterium]|nr:leucine-rich repeat domain-containing protein [Bacteroidaceae bacterium]